jgi:hypothetical protein
MKNLTTYEQYNEEVNEGMFRKFLTGHESAEDRDESMIEFVNALAAAEDLIMANPDDYAQSASWDRVKSRLEKEASDNNYKGGIDIRPSASDGLLYVTYRPGQSGLQLLAGSASFRRDNPLGK